MPRSHIEEGRGAPGLALALLLATLLGAGLRAVHLDGTLSHDEVATVERFVEGGPTAIFEVHGGFGSTNNHVLNSLLALESVRLFGLEMWALRLPSFLFGVATIPVAGLLALELFRRRSVALVAAFLVATSPLLIAFSPACRGYGPLVFFTTATAWLLLRTLDGSRRLLPLVVLGALGAGWSHMSGLVFLGTMGLFAGAVVLYRRAARRVGPAAPGGAGTLIALGLSAALLVLWYSRGTDAPDASSNLLADVFNRFVHREFASPSLAGLQSVEEPLGLRGWMAWTAKEFYGTRGAPLLVSLVLTAVGVLIGLRRHALGGLFLAFALLFPPASFLAADLRPSPRYFLFVQPFALFAMAIGLEAAAAATWSRLRPGRPGPPAWLSLAFLLAYTPVFLPKLREELSGPGSEYVGVAWDLCGPMDFLAERVQPGDVVLCSPRFVLPDQRQGWGFHRSYRFHQRRALVPILLEVPDAAAERRLWFLSPTPEVRDDELVPRGLPLERVAGFDGIFVHSAPLPLESRRLLWAPGFDLAKGSLGDWRTELVHGDLQTLVTRPEPSSDERARLVLTVGRHETGAEVLSPPIPVVPSTTVLLETALRAEQPHGSRPFVEAGLHFEDAAGELVFSEWRIPLPAEAGGAVNGRYPIRLETVVPRRAVAVRIFFRTAVGVRAGDRYDFELPGLHVERDG